MKITWRGHSCFLLENEQGTRVAIDPYDESVGYPMRPLESDVLLISHAHHDHSCPDMLRGNPIVIDGEGEYNVCGLRITGYASWHDAQRGALRGANRMYLIEMDGLRILHAGDLGEVPGASQLKRFGRVDIAMLPVGGTYTLTGEEAARVAQGLNAAVTLPMHYRTPRVAYPLTDEQPFLQAMGTETVQREKTLTVTPLTIQALPRVIVMEPEA